MKTPSNKEISQAKNVMYETIYYRFRRKNVFINAASMLIVPLVIVVAVPCSMLLSGIKGFCAGIQDYMDTVDIAWYRLLPYWVKKDDAKDTEIRKAIEILEAVKEKDN